MPFVFTFVNTCHADPVCVCVCVLASVTEQLILAAYKRKQQLDAREMASRLLVSELQHESTQHGEYLSDRLVGATARGRHQGARWGKERAR